jgi:hypothetical protein
MDQQLLMSLLAARNGGVMPDGAEDPQAMLARMAQDNPTVATLLQMMEAQKAAAAAREPLVIEADVEAPTESSSDAQLAELAARLDETQAEVRELRERCDTVAAALGACGICWGQDPSCRACRGQGAPGRAIPDKQLFCEFVLPAVRLVHASRQRSNQASKQTEGSTSWN